MEITYTLTPGDLLKYNLYFQRVSAVGRGHRRRFVIAIVAAAIGGVILAAALVRDTHALMGAVPAAVVAIALAPVLQRLAVRRALVRHLRDPRVQGNFGLYRVRFSKEGFHTASPIAETEVKWANVSEIVPDGEDYLYICLPTSAAHVISRNSYRGPVGFDQLSLELDRLRGRR